MAMHLCAVGHGGTEMQCKSIRRQHADRQLLLVSDLSNAPCSVRAGGQGLTAHEAALVLDAP